ncbi:HlyIII-domain-containing protein [Mollisia scopiformis]|uniref:HlyIII-domain-containing protein n=1 Tax=Mollisia scopiformis TaxID=149040 RepID=A0A194XQJ9_MOLSC|nr:HlyIII-domain-containing protein [Mollisia scopiformis]KUJ22473.1 HlyIII-domain-containing protein [Mollisia scopiformis]
MIRRKSSEPESSSSAATGHKKKEGEGLDTWMGGLHYQRGVLQREPLRRWDELEVWQQDDNQFIETGYRSASGSLSACFYSWKYLHNESVNIYSHLIGAAIFFILPAYLFRKEIPLRYAVATAADIIVFSAYFFGGAICFCLSATYHTLLSHSKSVERFGAQLDFQGVILLMWSATIPLLFYGFHCDVDLRNAYWTLLSVLAVICSISTFQPHFRGPYLRFVRAGTFGSLAIFTMVPVFHGTFKYGWAVQNQQMGVSWVITTLVVDILGATAYALKIPERWWRKTFDIWGASHQIFHVMVIVAALTYTKALLQAFDYVHADGKSCSTA